jgi:hypothetical protein
MKPDDDLVPSRGIIFDLAQAVAVPIRSWAHAHASIRPERIESCCMAAAVSVPFLPPAQVALLAKFALWEFAADDVSDSEALTLDQIEEAAAECAVEMRDPRLDRPRGAGTYRDFVDCLGEIAEALSAYPLYSEHAHVWWKSTESYLSLNNQLGRWDERYAADASDLPSWVEYMASAEHNGGTPAFADVAAILANDSDALAEYHWISQFAAQGSVAARLANDLRTWPKEIDQRRVNAVVLKQRERILAGIPPQDAHRSAIQDVESQLTLEMERFDALDARRPEPRPRTANAIRDVIRFAVGIYSAGDFHTTKVF